MKCKLPAFITAALVATLAIPTLLTAQKAPRYRLIDLGTFGGPNSYYFLPFGPSINNRGAVVGGADTTEPDSDTPCFGNACLTVHAFRWKDGKLKDLGALPNGANSGAIHANDSGLIAGFGDSGLIDPYTGINALVTLAWDHDQIIDIGGSFSFPNAINNRGEIVGVSQNAVPDDYAPDCHD